MEIRARPIGRTAESYELGYLTGNQRLARYAPLSSRHDSDAFQEQTFIACVIETTSVTVPD